MKLRAMLLTTALVLSTGSALAQEPATTPPFPTVEQSAAQGAAPVTLPIDTVERQFIGAPARKALPGETLPAGLVSLRILVNETGVVTGITPLKTTAKPLVQPAMDWVKSWKFRTYQLQKSTVRFTAVVIVRVRDNGKFEPRWEP